MWEREETTQSLYAALDRTGVALASTPYLITPDLTTPWGPTRRDLINAKKKSAAAASALPSRGRVWPAILANLARGGWLGGSDFTLADIAAIPYVNRCDVLGLDRL